MYGNFPKLILFFSLIYDKICYKLILDLVNIKNEGILLYSYNWSTLFHIISTYVFNGECKVILKK